MSQFKPVFTITPEIVQDLLRIEASKQQANLLPVAPTVIRSLRETAKLYTTHYSTMIEGNRLTLEQIRDVILLGEHIKGKERDEHEVKGFYEAFGQLECYVRDKVSLTEKLIQTFHALVMAGGSSRVKPTPYRTGQNVIRNGANGKIVYMPPEAKDVPGLMKGLVYWIEHNKQIPTPLVAAIAHYQFATIHPYYDGNGRTARLLATFILHSGGYDLKGVYSLDEYYAKDLSAYYHAISVGPSHNYYIGRAEADITSWITYFIKGMAQACEAVVNQMKKAQHQGVQDYSQVMHELDPKQRKALVLFSEYKYVTSQQIAELLHVKQRTAADLCSKWVKSGFLEIADSSFKSRKYKLSASYSELIKV